jgi:LPXTG-site transpeptidase (sortase) family protein
VSRPRPALVVFWTSIGVIAATLIVLFLAQWQLTEETDIQSIGSRPAATASTSVPTPAPSEVPSGSPSPSPSPSSEAGPQLVAAPMRLDIPALNIDTKVFPVGLDANKAIAIPEDIRYVGWYKLGVPPGVDRGSAVIVGHRDGRVQGRGVFYWLGNLNLGDKVYVKTSAGKNLPYKVVARELIKKKSLPYKELFAVDGPPRLTLISCGGYYDRNNGGYQDNIVVTAVPLFTPISTEPSSSSDTTSSSSPSLAPTASAAPAASQAAAASAEPASVFAPQAATVEETSTPVPLGGSN